MMIITRSAMGERDDETGGVEKARIPLLRDRNEEEEEKDILVETKKLWRIVGPAIFTRITTYLILVITQAFAGHLGELELAAISIVNNVIIGFNFGLLLGMASALETLCGQAFGAKKYNMLGVYLQRSWIVLFLFAISLLPMYFFATPILKYLGQPDDIAELSGTIAVWVIPIHFAFAFVFPLNRFLQCQLRNVVIAIASGVALVVHIFVCWLFVYVLELGVIGTMATVNVSWWFNLLVLFTYTTCGGCPLTWTGFSIEAFTGLWEFAKLSVSSDSLENWYYKILILMTGNLKDTKIVVDSLMSINGLELMIPIAFLAGTGVRVANELGAGSGKRARFAMIVSVTQSLLIGIIFSVLVVFLHDQIGWIFSSSETVIKAVNDLSILLAFTILLNSVQPVLSGVAIGSGWQSFVAYINLGCYYFIGLPLGFVMGWIFKSGVKGIWGGMILGGTGIQTLVLIFLVVRCDWEKEAQKASARMGERDDDAQGTLEKARIPLLRDQHAAEDGGGRIEIEIETWMETKKLWRIVGPAIFSRVSTYSIFVITQAFAGHLGELELAAISIVHNVIISFSFGLLLGMASALETLCGQAFGAKKYDMLGVYMQRSWIVLFLFCILLLPMYLFASPILKFFGQPDDIAELTGIIAVWTIPTHFAYAFYLPLSRFLQCQLKNRVVAFSSGLALVVHIFVCCLFVNGLKLGVIGTMATINVSWWFNVFILFTYTTCGGCPLGPVSPPKLSPNYGNSLSSLHSLEYWYYKILIVMTGNMEDTKIAVDSLSICMSINGLEMMIPFAFFAGTGVRVANELGAGSGRRARFAMVVSVTQSLIIGIIFSVLVAFLHDQIAYPIQERHNSLLGPPTVFTILLNSVQPILSGVAVGSGWQSSVAYINLGCYYFIGLPLGFVMGWIFKSGVKNINVILNLSMFILLLLLCWNSGIWAGMIFGGTAIQTLILTCIVMRCDWEKEVYDFFMPKKQMFALRDGLVEMNNALEQYASSASSSTPPVSNQVTFYFLVIVKSEDPAMEERADEAQVPLEKAMIPLLGDDNVAEEKDRKTKRKIWMETKKLWRIVGPAIFTRVSTYSIFIITQAFAGHLGELELAAISIVNNVIVGFNYGLLLGMATALETLCGQAFGAKKYDKLGVYLQRSWIVLFLCSILLLPVYFFTSPILKFVGQPDDIAELSGTVAVWAIPAHFSFAFFFPINRFLQSQLKNMVIAISSGVAFVVHIFVCWLFVYVLKLGVIGTIATANVSWWLNVFILFTYTTCGGCPLTWTGFSVEAFTRLWEFTKLSASSGIMLWKSPGRKNCCRLYVYMVLNIFIDSMLINGLETMIPLAFFAGTSVRVANELGAGNGGKARFAMIISVIQSLIIGIILSVLVVFLHNQIGWIFSSSEAVIKAVNNLSILLAFTILLNSVYPVLSGAAVGSGWQSVVAYINLGCYYFIGLPLGFVMGWVFNTGVKGIWAGMIFGGTAIQTFILIFITMRCDWENEAQKASMRVKNWQVSDARK
ncbi:hypothetical protein HID58_089442 [Brassica napus]|uniref:Protein DETOXIFICATION n=1 Tax=Brassica napus TaxID=3708 RepID=A0ABQ7XZ14_BRANA|nr:hypothetical protein HID58_089442 [Brassica napus]